jgi:beta-1,2-mannosidase
MAGLADVRSGMTAFSRRRVLGAAGAMAAGSITACFPPADCRRSAARFPLGPFTRYNGNPILRPIPNHPWESAYLYNPCAIVVNDRVALLYRAQDAAKVSSIGLAWSRDGLHFERLPKPVLSATEPWETPGGCEDPRVVRVNGTYYMTYAAYDLHSALLCLATSTNLVDWKKYPPLFPGRRDPLSGDKPWSKSGSIYPERINGWYWMYFGDSNIFWARSRDLIHWEAGPLDDPVAKPVYGWERSLIEPGPPVVRTIDGLLLLVYNGRATGDPEHREGQYSGGQLLIDPANPTKAVARLERPFIQPRAEDEQNGQVNNVVFSEGLVYFRNRWLLYYGMADSVLGVMVHTP